MLPKKRPVEVLKPGEDSGSDSDTGSLRKKARIGCLTASCASVTSRGSASGTGECDGKKSGGGGEESSVSASSTVVEPSVTNMGLEDVNMQEIDEDLHSRQLAVYGRETMRRLFASNVLISGMQGLGAETGKYNDFILYIYGVCNA
ncbi:putative ubiquitin-activating enzyme [Helianthus anomalus]